MVYDFRLPDDALAAAMGVMAAHGGMLQVHCEDPALLDAGIAAALARGETAPRFHASSRPPLVEAVATARALGFARRPGRRSTSCTSSSAAARGGPPREGAGSG
jgi:dihydropyrimidinase